MSDDTFKVFGYPVRDPFDSEDRFFKENPQIGGMASEDEAIVLNPHSPLSASERAAVAKNEAARLWMRANKPALDFELTDEQRSLLSGTSYAGGTSRAAKETIIGRLLSGDPSGGTPTLEQLMALDMVRRGLAQRQPAPAPGGADFADGAFGLTENNIASNVSALPLEGTNAPDQSVGEILYTLPGNENLPREGVELPTRARRQAVTPWSDIEARPEFQNLSAHGKRLVKAQYLADIDKMSQTRFTKEKDRAKYMETTVGLIPDYKDPTRSVGDWLNDFNIAIQTGAASVTGSIGEVGRMLGAGGDSFEGDPMSLGNLFNPAAQDAAQKIWQTQKSLASQDFQKFKAEREAAARAEPGAGEFAAGKAVLGAYVAHPSEALLSLAEQVPIIGSFVGPGGLARGAAVVPRLRTALQALKAGTMSAEEAAAAIVAADRAGVTAGRLATGSIGAVMESADAKQTFIDKLSSQPDEVWQADPEWAAAVAAGEDPKAAKKRLAGERSGWATGIGAALGVLDGITGFERLFIGPTVAGIRKRLLSAASEPLMESLQGINPLAVANLQAQGMDPKQAFTSGFGPAVAEALVVALPLGVATGVSKGAGLAEETVTPPEAVLPPAAAGGAPAAPGGPPPGGPGPTVGPPLPSAIEAARAGFQEAQTQLAEAERVRGDGTSTPQQVAAAETTIKEAGARVDELNKFMAAWENVPAVKELEQANAKDERRIAELEADQRADPDAKAREIGALQNRIEGRRALAEVNALNENDLQAYIDSREKSLAAADAQRGLGITVDRARLTNEIAHAQRLLEERAEIQTPAEVAFTEREPTVFPRDAAGVPQWPDNATTQALPFEKAIDMMRDRALSLINLVRGNPQFTRGQRTAAINKARAAYESANRIGEAWTLSDEELATRETDLVQAIGSGLTGTTGYNPGHFAELAGVIAAQSARKGKPLTYRDALQEAKARIGAIYLPPSQVGGGATPTSTPANPAGDTSASYFYDDTPFIVGGVTVTRTSTDPEKKLWDATIKALVRAGFPKRVLDMLGIRIASTEHPSALGLYIQSALDAKLGPNPLYTIGMNWGKHAAGNTKDHQWTAVHEVSHAIADSQRNGTDVSEVDKRFLAGGEFRSEIETAWDKGKGPLDRFYYPLSPTFGYSNADIAAELWAQSTAYYFVDRAALQKHAPKTFAFVEKFYADIAKSQFANRQQLGAEVQRLFSGLPPTGVAVPGTGGPTTPGGGPVTGPAGPATPPAGGTAATAGGAGVAPAAPPVVTPTPQAPKRPKAPPAAAPTSPAPAPAAPVAPAPAAPVAPAAPAAAAPLDPKVQLRFDSGVADGEAGLANGDPGLAAWRGFTADDLTDAMESARSYFALPEGPAKQAAGAELRDMVGSPNVGDWNTVLGNLAYRAGLSTGLGKPSATSADLSAAIEETQRIIDDAIQSVQTAIEQESGAGATGVQGTQPAGPAGQAAGVQGKPGGKPKGKRKKLKRPAAEVGGPEAPAPAAVAGPVRPAEVGGAKLRRPSNRAEAPRQQPAQAAEGGRAAQAVAAPRPQVVAASSLKAGDRVQDEFGNEVTVDSVEDGTVYVKGTEGFVYETTAFPLGSEIPGRRKRKPRTPKPQALEPGATTPAPVVTRDAKAGRELAQRQIRWAIDNARDLQAAMEDHRRNMIGDLMTAKQLGFDDAVTQLRQEILNLSRAISAIKTKIGTLLDSLTQRRIIEKVVGEPTTIARLENILGRLFGVLPGSVRKRLPRILFARESEIGPDGRFALPGGRYAIVEAGTAAHYIPETNTITLFVDRIPKGKELGLILHELFHKRGGQLLGKQQMLRLMDEVMKWGQAPIGSAERKIYQGAIRRISSAAGTEVDARRAETIKEEMLPYFISEAVDQGYVPDVKNIMAPGVKGWLARAWKALSDRVARAFGGKVDPGKFGVNELMTAAWGAAQYELDAQQYEAVANGEQINPDLPGDARARLALGSAQIFAERRAEMRRGEGLFIPELLTAEERRAGVRGEGISGSRGAQVDALNAAPKSAVVQAATASPAVGPTNPAKSITEMFKPSEARPIRTGEDLQQYMETGNRPTVEWMQQARDRAIENYVDHQRPFLSWLRRHALDMTAWAKLKLVPGRLKARSDTYQRELLAPIERSIAAFAKTNGVPQEQAALDAGWWATLQHIEEANAALRQKLVQALVAGEPRAAEKLAHFDRTQRDALKPGEARAPMAGGLTNAQAAEAMAKLQARYGPAQHAALQKIADDIVAGFAKLKNDAVASGQISKDALKNFPKFTRYVALTGPNQGIWDDQVSDGFGSYIAENRLREREGRTQSVSENALEALAERVGRVSAYDASNEFKAELNNLYEKSGGDQNTIGLQRFVANMVQSPTKSDIVWNGPDGKRYVFRFSDGESIGESLLGKNREYHETIGLKLMDYLTRKFSRAVTQWIPLFGPVNAIRDVQEKAILIRSRDVKDANGKDLDANQLFKRTWSYALSPDTWRTARQLAFGGSKRAQENTAIGRHANELITEGGVSTWGEITRKGLASIEEAVRQEGRRAGLGRGDQNARQNVEDFVRNYNLMFEIVSSLSVNAAMRDMGVSAKDAAFNTLDLMNFQNVGARSGWLRAAFAFFNPAAQSGYNLYRQIIKSPRGRRDFFGLLAMSFLLQGLLRALGDDDEDLGNELDQRGTWEVDRNIPVNILGTTLKIPVGFGAPQFAWSMMNSTYRWMSGRYDTGDAVAQSAIGVLKNFNPIPISEVGPTKQPLNFLVKTFTPTVFRPAVDFATDSDTWGGKLTAYYPDKTKYRSEQGRPTTSVFYKDLAEGLQGIGLDMYPEQVKAMTEAIAWGPFGYALQAVADSNKENEGRRLNPMDKLPASALLKVVGASRFIGGESRYLEARYYENYDRALDDLRDFNRAKSDGKEAVWRSEHPNQMRRVSALQDQERVMRALSKDFNSTVRDLQNQKTSIERAQPHLERIQNSREAAMRKFLRNLQAWGHEEDDQP